MWILIIIILIVVVLVAVVKNDNKQIQINHLQNGGFRKSYPLVTKCLEEVYEMSFFDDLGNSFSYSKNVIDVNGKRGTLYIGLKLDMGRDTIVFSTYTNSEGVKYEGQDISTIYTLSEYIIIGIDNSLEKLIKDGILPNTNSKVENENNEFNNTNTKNDNKLRDFFIEILKDTDQEDFKTKDTTDILLDALERNEIKIEKEIEKEKKEKEKKLLNYRNLLKNCEELKIVIDIDCNVYQTIQIGDQIWMAENLRVSRYRNGDLITNIQDNKDWKETKSGAWCNYEDNLDKDVLNGKLYNWFAVNDQRGLAPEGWHIPSEDEWSELTGYIEVNKIGEIINEQDTLVNCITNKKADSIIKFVADSCGIRQCSNGILDPIGVKGGWWCSTDFSWNCAKNMFFYDIDFFMTYFTQKKNGLYVRCIKDK